MIKLAILGVENTHAWNFSQFLDGKDGTKIFSDVELIGFYGDNSKEDVKIAKEEIAQKSNCAVFAEHYNDFLQEADAIMVTARHGANHFKYAEEYIKKGIPVWIDKPITCDTEELIKLIDLAKEYNCPITGGSVLPHLYSVKEMANLVKENGKNVFGGHVTAPINMKNPYGDFWFYSQHLVQMIITTFGDNIKSVQAFECSEGVNAIFSYDDFNVSAYFGTDYTISVYLKDNKVVFKPVELDVDRDIKLELDAFYNVIKNKKSDMTYRELALPVYIIDAIIKSFKENRKIDIICPF